MGSGIMKIRIGALVLLSTLVWMAVSPAAQAQSDRTTVCEGKYKQAAESYRYASSEFGTIYSGGLHFSHTDNVGSTVHFYRTLLGLGDNNARRWRYGSNFDSHAFKAQNLEAIES